MAGPRSSGWTRPGAQLRDQGRQDCGERECVQSMADQITQQMGRNTAQFLARAGDGEERSVGVLVLTRPVDERMAQD